MSGQKWNAGRIRRALTRYLHWYQTLVIPEFDLDGGRCDLLQISRAGYATEFEIKISRSDWRADAEKQKWEGVRPHIARFFYVVPKILLPDDGALDFCLPAAGILTVDGDGVAYDHVREHRSAKRLKAEKVDEQTRRRALEAFYYRYWRHEGNMEDVRRQLADRRRTCPECYGRLRCPVCESRSRLLAVA